jgi:hypothetical protein
MPKGECPFPSQQKQGDASSKRSPPASRVRSRIQPKSPWVEGSFWKRDLPNFSPPTAAPNSTPLCRMAEIRLWRERLRSTVLFQGPFLGQSMNCRACHLGDEFGGTAPGMRTLADFAIRSAIPNRGDSRRTTVRNSPSLVNLSIHPTGRGLFHYDGEFPNVRSLVRGTLTGRNFGWLPEERTQGGSTHRAGHPGKTTAARFWVPNGADPTHASWLAPTPRFRRRSDSRQACD